MIKLPKLLPIQFLIDTENDCDMESAEEASGKHIEPHVRLLVATVMVSFLSSGSLNSSTMNNM